MIGDIAKKMDDIEKETNGQASSQVGTNATPQEITREPSLQAQPNNPKNVNDIDLDIITQDVEKI